MSENSPESRAGKPTVKFNPPALEQVDSRYIPGRDLVESPTSPGRAERIATSGELTGMSRKLALSRKGWFAPDTTYASDWSDSEDDEIEGDGSTYDSEQDTRWDSGPLVQWWDSLWGPPDVTAPGESDAVDQYGNPVPRITEDTLFSKNQKYGFRFMYNPVTLSFQTGVTTNVNVSYLMSGQGTAVPSGVASTGASIGVTFPISRVDDITILRGGIDGWDDANQLSAASLSKYRGLYNNSFQPQRNPYGFGTYDAEVTAEDLFGIATRGTMYDLEFMFRAFLGRQWKTYYRAYTADIGIAFSAPLVLYLSPTMIYRVRLGSLGYTHRVFTPDMVPTYTEVTLGFERIPDVIDYK